MFNRLRSFALLFLGFVLLPSAIAQQTRTMRIAAAADLEPVLPAVIAEFHNQTGANLTVSYASSATLATQIINGAPFDLFLSADLSFPQKVIAAGRGDTDKPIPYARGTLVLWTRNDSAVGNLSVNTLRNPSVKRIAVADAEHAPYGRAAIAAINSLGLKDTVANKLVVAQNIAQAAQFADSGNADVGLISLTSALTLRLENNGKYLVMPPASYPPILQGAVVIKGSPSCDEARRFLAFMASPAMRKRLSERGLNAP